MKKLRPKDVFMKDIKFDKDLKIKKVTEETEMFDSIMNSVCDKGININKETVERIDGSKFKSECMLFKDSMRSLEVKPL
jgi:hypothetical protein